MPTDDPVVRQGLEAGRGALNPTARAASGVADRLQRVLIVADPPGTAESPVTTSRNRRAESRYSTTAPSGQPQVRWITGFGGRLTTEDPAVGPSLHCEVEPWAPAALRAAYDRLRVGDRVRVRGRWGFDGVHLGVPMWREVLAAAVRHQPNVQDGWFELHPVTELEVFS